MGVILLSIPTKNLPVQRHQSQCCSFLSNTAQLTQVRHLFPKHLQEFAKRLPHLCCEIPGNRPLCYKKYAQLAYQYYC